MIDGKQQQFVFIVDRIESIDAEIAEKKEERKAEVEAAKAAGFSARVLSQMIKERREDQDELEQFLADCEEARETLRQPRGRAPVNDDAKVRKAS